MRKEPPVPPCLNLTRFPTDLHALCDPAQFSLDDVTFSVSGGSAIPPLNFISPPIPKSEQLATHLFLDEDFLNFKPAATTTPATSARATNCDVITHQQPQHEEFEDSMMEEEFHFDEPLDFLVPTQAECEESPRIKGEEEAEEEAEGAKEDEEMEEEEDGEEVEEMEEEEQEEDEDEDSNDSDFEEHEKNRKRPRRASRVASPASASSKKPRGPSAKGGKRGKGSGARGSKKDKSAKEEPGVVKERKKPGRKPKILDEETKRVRSQLRQEKNRVAARRCRERKQEYFLLLEDEVNKLRQEKEEMGKEITSLREIVSSLRARLGE